MNGAKAMDSPATSSSSSSSSKLTCSVAVYVETQPDVIDVYKLLLLAAAASRNCFQLGPTVRLPKSA